VQVIDSLRLQVIIARVAGGIRLPHNIQKGGKDMAAPFSTSHLKNSPRAKRWFTIEQANRTLPLVTRIVRDIVNAHERYTQLQGKLDDMPGARELPAIQEQLQASLERLQEYADELASVGIELKDPESGLIDFPGRHQGRDVYLCWKLGEDKVDHWHELHAGYAGRQPLNTLEEE
jgi:hypothetical protein